jgi:hypothetical protein
MSELEQRERECLARYCALLAERLGADLLAVQMFDSDDIDLLVVTAGEIPEDEQEELRNEAHPVSLECGRRISLHFVSQASLVDPKTERVRELLVRIRSQAVNVWPGPVTM